MAPVAPELAPFVALEPAPEFPPPVEPEPEFPVLPVAPEGCGTEVIAASLPLEPSQMPARAPTPAMSATPTPSVATNATGWCHQRLGWSASSS